MNQCKRALINQCKWGLPKLSQIRFLCLVSSLHHHSSHTYHYSTPLWSLSKLGTQMDYPIMPQPMISCPKTPHVTYIGATLPPISTKLLKLIKQGTFIEMAELLSESLGHFPSDEDRQVVKPKCRMVTYIIEWLQCFGTYITIIIIMEAAFQGSRFARLPKSYHSSKSRISGGLLVGV